MKLRSFGLSDEVVELAWPAWWSEEAESSPSARAELRFTLARRLGLDAKALLENDEPRFMWKVGTFKNLSATTSTEREAIVSYGTCVARTVLSAAPGPDETPRLGAQELRARLLATAPFIGLPDLLALCWAVGVPTIHLETVPLKAKRMCAMAVRVGGRYVILLARKSNFPSQVAYYVAHELGHIFLGHLVSSPAVVDLEDPLVAGRGADEEEALADGYALELLTGEPEPRVLTAARRYSAAGLAKAVLDAGPRLGIEPGMLALCFGHSTARWDKTVAALKRVYPMNRPVGPYVNQVAFSQITAGELSEEGEDFLRGATGTAR